ncbi:MAG: glycosyltransferase family 4 protein [Planctomycetota bacterium]
MRIVHLYANWKWTGPAEPAVNLAATLARRGHDVLFVPGRPVGDLENLIATKARERGLDVREGLALDKHWRPIGNHLDARRLSTWFDEFRPDIVHAHTLNDHLVGAAAARRHRPDLPVVRSLYDGEASPAGWRTRLAFGRRTDFLLSASDRVRGETATRFGMDPARTAVYDVPIDLARFDPDRELPDLRAEYGIEPGDFVVGIVARMQRHRRFEVFFDGLDRAFADVENLRVLIVGRGTNMREVAVERAANTSLGDRIVFTGYRADDEYVATLAAMDAKVFLWPGSDGSCRAVREALAMGKPVISAKVGMLPEIVAGGRTGVLIDHDPEDLAAAVRMLADDAARKTMAEAARAEARARFDADARAAEVEAVYSSLSS